MGSGSCVGCRLFFESLEVKDNDALPHLLSWPPPVARSTPQHPDLLRGQSGEPSTPSAAFPSASEQPRGHTLPLPSVSLLLSLFLIIYELCELIWVSVFNMYVY